LKLITSHTARRTGATLMRLAGIPMDQIQKVTGHKTLKQLESYIKVGPDETTEILSTHPYFRNGLRIAT
jgi:integrase